MKQLKNILLVLEHNSLSDGVSADRIASLARLNDATVTAVVVDELKLHESLSMKLGSRKGDLLNALSEQHAEELNEYFAPERWRGIEVVKDDASVRGFIPIIQKVLRDGHDLVIKIDSREQGIEQLTMRLVRKCPCPVWIMKRAASQLKNIMAAIDVSAEYPETDALNDKIVEFTDSLAEREEGVAHYLHVWRLQCETALRGPRFRIPDEEIDQLRAELYEERQALLDQVLARNSIACPQEQIHLREGFGVEVIKEAITELGVDLVVMGSVARSGIPGLLIGNRAEQLLSVISCSVLTIKPDGFVSPVTLD